MRKIKEFRLRCGEEVKEVKIAKMVKCQNCPNLTKISKMQILKWPKKSIYFKFQTGQNGPNLKMDQNGQMDQISTQSTFQTAPKRIKFEDEPE